MCTSLIWFDPSADISLRVAFNRDERYSRAEMAPSFFAGDCASALYPVDLSSAGTWFGVNSRGLVAMLLNDNRLSRTGKGSRGRWLADLLGNAVSVEAAHTLVMDEWRSHFTPSWVVLGSVDRLIMLRMNSTMTSYELSPGFHIVCDSSGFGQSKRAKWLRKKAEGCPAPQCFEDVRGLLAEHFSCARRYYTTCCHAGTSGTVSAQFLQLSRQKKMAAFSYLSSSPCTADRPQDFELPLLLS
ncbi:hypothetical protein GFL72_30900 [Rhizobium leguminosarum bv. viciae]|uniref:NRDE family protein n=1 Tax=Rhizobium leguminosarum TaxID=384 RepID=UPI001442802C|nr:NRDE family protein [Rhizobium leguminosarum]NKK38972.1 hypothetical protein [Rhizobium leguminosarum bv. viciae]